MPECKVNELFSEIRIIKFMRKSINGLNEIPIDKMTEMERFDLLNIYFIGLEDGYETGIESLGMKVTNKKPSIMMRIDDAFARAKPFTISNTLKDIMDYLGEEENRIQNIFHTLPDARSSSLEIGDMIAGEWFNDPIYYVGILEDINGQLGIPTEKGVGLIDDADHVVLIKKDI